MLSNCVCKAHHEVEIKLNRKEQEEVNSLLTQLILGKQSTNEIFVLNFIRKNKIKITIKGSTLDNLVLENFCYHSESS